MRKGAESAQVGGTLTAEDVVGQWDVSMSPYSNAEAGSVDYPIWQLGKNMVNPALDVLGGIVEQSSVGSIAAKRRIQWGEGANTLALEFETDAPQWELLCSASPKGGNWRVLVHDVGSSDWRILGSWSTETPAIQLFQSKDNERKARRWRVEYSNQLALGVRLKNNEKISANLPKPPLKRVVWVGDSYAEGTGAPSVWQGFVGQAGMLLNVDSHFDAAGGTGYIAEGPKALNRKPYGERMDNIVQANPSVVVIYGTINDGQFPPQDVAAAAKKFWGALHQALPKAQIIAIGPVQPSSKINLKPLSDALASAAAESDVKFVDATSWIQGTGNVAKPQGDGNADTFIGADGIHPTLAGHDYLGKKTAEALRPLLNSAQN